MARLSLSSKSRTDLRKSETKRIRREGGIPATIYGRGEESHSVEVSYNELLEILKSPSGRLSLIDLKVDGKSSKAHPVMLKEMQRDLISKKIVHVEFHRVSMDEPVNATVPIIVHGEAPGVKLGGNLELVSSDVEVRALPDNVPTHIDVDVSELNMGDSIHVSDLKVAEGVEITHPLPEIAVVTVRPPAVRAEAAPAAEAAEAGEAAETPAAE